MAVSEILRLVVVLAGVFFLCLDFLAFCYRKMTESIGLGWGCFAVLMILSGALPGVSSWSEVMEGKNYIAIFIMGFFLLLGGFALSVSISQLTRKNQELAMQVSLLNQENEMILNQLAELEKKNKGSEE